MPVQQLLEATVCALVDEPGAVVITAVEQETGTLFRVKVAPDDLGKVIGKQGRTARAIRAVLSACSMKDGHRYMLDIVENPK